jgi:superfamily II DNA or RNA helicase
MENNPYQTRQPNIERNQFLRTPQREGFHSLTEYAQSAENEREVGIVLPVGCGKSGLMTLAPFAFRAERVLVVAPGVRIARQLLEDFDQTQEERFYIRREVLIGPPFPEPVEIRGTTTNRADLEESDVVITNIQQLQGGANRWLTDLSPDFFDLILNAYCFYSV